MVKINFGCGINKLEGWRNVDYYDYYQPDSVIDLNKMPLPLDSNMAEEINCFHIVEHLDDIRMFIRELYRISKKGCIIHIRYPHFSDRSAYADPTHKHYLGQSSLLYFENKHLGEPEALLHDVKFRTKKHSVICNPLFQKLVNKAPDFWERHKLLCFIAGMKEVCVDFEVLK